MLDEILKGRHLENSDVPVIEKAVQEGWIKVVNVKKHRTPELPKNLGAGETEAIILILQADEKIDWLLMDDEIATKTARSMGIVVRSASYLPIFWARKGNVKVSEAVGMLDDLVSSGYRLPSQDYVAIKDLIVETG